MIDANSLDDLGEILLIDACICNVPNSVKILVELDNLRQDVLHIFEGQNEIPIISKEEYYQILLKLLNS